MRKPLNQIINHVLGWMALLLMPVIFAPHHHGLRDTFNPYAIRDYVIIFLLIGFFYFNSGILIPKFYLKKKYFVYVFCIVLCYFVTCFLPAIIISYNRFPPFLFETFHNIFVFLVIFFISFTIRINKQWKLAEQQRLSAELTNLKAQVRPHFLFNTLNSIYSLIVTKSETAASAVVMLSNLMRYLLSESAREFVELEKEIHYLSDYIELQKIRLGETVKINFTVNGNITDQQIAPLILIPFVENAFKHGVNPEERSHITMSIDITDNELNMTVSNNKVAHLNDANETGGTGIDNVRKRLQLLYPSSHELVILDKEYKFTIKLKLMLS